ncbi:MAG: hypothetical protein JWM50_2645 [Microbacteriaceae bacterium]|jgi:hypothetical protein|nr:hypothetical protein [Microbacteriaceae bacterium]
MSDTNLTPSPDEVPAVDVDDELGLAGPDTAGSDRSVAEFGEEPDVETRSDEAPEAIDPSI